MHVTFAVSNEPGLALVIYFQPSVSMVKDPDPGTLFQYLDGRCLAIRTGSNMEAEGRNLTEFRRFGVYHRCNDNEPDRAD